VLPYLPSPFSEWTTVRARYRALEATFGLSPDRLHHIAKSREMAAYFRGMVAAGAAPEPAARWLRVELAQALSRKGPGVHQCRVGPDAMASLVRLVSASTISSETAKGVLAKMWDTSPRPRSFAARTSRLAMWRLWPPSSTA